jgi:F-type H+-transporting ATPase subunit beta
MALLGEWTYGLWTRGRGCAVFVDWPARPVQVDDLVREWSEQGIERGVALVLGRATDMRAQRRRAVLAALATAERLRDEGREVLLAVAATDVEWHILSRLRDRLPCIAGGGSITLVVLDIWWDGVPTPLSGIRAWDSWVAFDRARARSGLHPAVDPLTSGSHLLDGSLLGAEHARIADHARALLRRYPDIHPAASGPDADAYCPTDRRHAARARRLQRFLTQPLHVKEAVTGRPGERVAIGDTLAGVAALLDGRYDDRPEDSFFNIGAIDPTPTHMAGGRG